MHKLGWRASDTRELSFKDVAVPEGNLLGPRGEGFKQFLEILDGGRISVASMGVGLAQGAYDLAYAYAKEREQFGKPIAKFQAVQFALADMAFSSHAHSTPASEPSMIRKLLVANRGEIALRVFRACRELGIETVAVAPPDDGGALHARSAGETVEIASYLASEEHIRAAKQSGADAIHPGYGFLAENADFARAVEAAGLVWVGPTPEALEIAGDKLRSKQVAREAGVPVVESGEPAELGFPLILKAAAGGGGRGMRVVRGAHELDEARAAASREAQAAFGDGTVFAERYVERPRHIEIQLLGDVHGTVVSLGERECSIQRRHQKVLEEAPSPALDPALRAQIGEAAVAFARAIGYRGAGTAEFMLSGRDFWFLELNGRIQVEHPVTELVTGVDLVKQQLRIAQGEPLERERRVCYSATPSRCACTPRTRARFSRRAGRSSACACRPASASTRASRKATRSRSPTTR